MRHMIQKDFYIRTLIRQLIIDKLSIFHEIAPNFTYLQKLQI